MDPSSSQGTPNPRTPSLRVARIAMLTAVAVAGGYLLVAVPNIELLTLTIAFAGLLLGASSAMLVGLAAGAIFGTLNVMGLPYPPVWIAQLIGYAFTGFLFGRFRSSFVAGKPAIIAWKCAAGGFVATLLFDALTNIAFPASTGVAPTEWWPYLIAGIPFAITHLLSNTLLFALLLPVAYRRLGQRYAL